MFHGSDQSLIWWQFGYIACWIFFPLVPAVLIYLIFPNTQTTLGGPFSGLTLRSSGAFSAYFVILLVSYPVWKAQGDDLRSYMRPTWQVEGQVKVFDGSGREVVFPSEGSKLLSIALKPNLISTKRNRFRITVPEIQGAVPSIVIKYEGIGDYMIDPGQAEQGEDVRVDRGARRIVIASPLVIRKKPCEGMCQ